MKLILVVAFISLLCLGKAAKLPSTFKICSRSDPDLNGCFKSAVQTALVQLKDGIPSLGVTGQEPLQIESMVVDATQGAAVNVQQKFNNLKIYGVTDSTVDGADLKLGDKTIDATVHITIHKAKADADYDFDGKILMLPISGKGKCFMELEESKVVITMKGDIVEKKGKNYVHLTDMKVDLIPEKATFKFDNLFNGNKELGDQMNNMINDNWKDLFAEVKSSYEESLSAVVKSVADNIFSKVPYDELLPA